MKCQNQVKQMFTRESTHKKKETRPLATLAAPHEETAEEESHGEKEHFHSNL